MTETTPETTADMMRKAYATLQELDDEVGLLREAIIEKLVPDRHKLQSFIREHNHWRRWVGECVALYRLVHEGTAHQVLAVGLEISLLEDRIRLMKNSVPPEPAVAKGWRAYNV